MQIISNESSDSVFNVDHADPRVRVGKSFGLIGMVLATVISLIYGILALVPAGPFTVQNIPIGVTLTVLSSCGVMAAVGFMAGALLGYIIGTPIACCNNL